MACAIFESTAFAQDIFIPPQYVCTAVDSNDMEFLGVSYDDEEVLFYDYSGVDNNKVVAQTVESAMKKCLLNSKDPQSCDIVSCRENPQ
jgi:hypothetical protein